MECPYCGSRQLVWDTSNGYVVCSECGSVVDTIYDYTPTTTRNVEEVARRKDTCRSRGSRETRRRLSLYERLARKRKPGLVMREENVLRYIETGGRVKAQVFVRVDTPRILEEAVAENPRLPAIMKLLEKYPRLASRTLRLKLAIALYLYARASGMVVGVDRIAARVGVNPKHFRRVKKLVDREKRLIRDVVQVLAGSTAVEEGNY